MAEKKEKMNVTVGKGPKAADEHAFSPLVDIYEDAEGTTVLAAELPGAKAEGVDIRVDKGVLTITADAPLPEVDPKYSQIYTSFVGGQYFRAFALSDEIDRDKIEAGLDNGVLTIRLPRAKTAQTRKIQIKTG